jgi:hypothetical protein
MYAAEAIAAELSTCEAMITGSPIVRSGGANTVRWAIKDIKINEHAPAKTAHAPPKRNTPAPHVSRITK